MSSSARRHFAADHPAAAGHFPGNPVIPGAVLLGEIVDSVTRGTDPRPIVRAIRSAKFLHPVRPDDLLQIDWSDLPDGMVRFECQVGEYRVLTGTLLLDRTGNR